jgi:hypothetical protein
MRPLGKDISVIVVRKDVFQDAGCFRYEPRRTSQCDDDDFFPGPEVYGPMVVVLGPPAV